MKLIKNLLSFNSEGIKSKEEYVIHCNVKSTLIISLLAMCIDIALIIGFLIINITEYKLSYILVHSIFLLLSLITFIVFYYLQHNFIKHVKLLNFFTFLYIVLILLFSMIITHFNYKAGYAIPTFTFFITFVCLMGVYSYKPYKSAIFNIVTLTIFTVFVSLEVKNLNIINSIISFKTLIKEFNNIQLIEYYNQFIFSNVILLFIISFVVNFLNYNFRIKQFETNLKLSENNRKLESLNKELYYKSTTDTLTGLKNRAYLRDEFVDCMRKANALNQQLYSVVVDVDDFKIINDNNGHEAGDECLQAIGQIIKKSFSYSYRYGGEEFFIFDYVETEAEFTKMIYQLKEEINNIYIVQYPNIKVTISIGVYIKKPDLSESYETFFIKADKALYKAKSIGKNSVHIVKE